ncbi:MAG: ABC transporter ATP-binding protein/permease [Anaerolineales bacterium]|nr:ABC transporter ATP-binding protein/permease [Anaerolineales bacterium]MCX7755695.1 ABC transporter ATP-binding protein/permease [Anaerolineales bacterium]MDW8277704.1 ABC transporter ATP-binding protein [Anaerolineales bacterium]
MTTIVPPAYVTQSEELYDKPLDPQVARRLVGFIAPYKWQLLLAAFLMLVATLSTVIGPYLVKIAIDDGLLAGNLTALRNAVLLYLAAALVRWGFIYLRVNIMAQVGQSFIYDLRKMLFEHLQKLSLGFYSRYSVGRVITRVINDVETLREFVIWAVLAIARDLFALAGIIVAMLSLNFELSLITFATIPLMILATRLYRRTARVAYRRVRAAISWVNSVLAENINGVRVVQAFNRQTHNYRQFSEYTNRYHLQMVLRAARVAASFLPVVDVLGALATAAVVWIGGTAVLGESISAGVLVAFVLYIDRYFEPIRDLSRRFDTLQSTMAGGERILALLDTEVDVQDAPDARPLPPIRGDVTFENVSFHYPDDSALVLRNIHLHVPAGSTVALVGETGAGKTTLVKLLSRFMDPTEGRVLVDGFDLKTVTQKSLRAQMGVVLQDPFLFNGTVKENILFGRLDATDAEVEAAARAVGAHDFIMELRNGYDTSVEEGGVLLSVGQRQLISFARALLANPRILILDEATSSVDTQTEQVIQRALVTLLKGRTSFVIAHRLSTITNADLIVVIDDGQIVEQGTHAELLAQRGAYYRLYQTGFQE